MDTKKHNATVFLNFIPGDRVEWWLLTGEIFRLLKSHCLHWVCVILSRSNKYLIVPGRKLSIRNCFHRKLFTFTDCYVVSPLLSCRLIKTLMFAGWLECQWLELRWWLCDGGTTTKRMVADVPPPPPPPPSPPLCDSTVRLSPTPSSQTNIIVKVSWLGGVPHTNIDTDFSRNWIVAITI